MDKAGLGSFFADSPAHQADSYNILSIARRDAIEHPNLRQRLKRNKAPIVRDPG